MVLDTPVFPTQRGMKELFLSSQKCAYLSHQKHPLALAKLSFLPHQSLIPPTN